MEEVVRGRERHLGRGTGMERKGRTRIRNATKKKEERKRAKIETGWKKGGRSNGRRVKSGIGTEREEERERERKIGQGIGKEIREEVVRGRGSCAWRTETMAEVGSEIGTVVGTPIGQTGAGGKMHTGGKMHIGKGGDRQERMKRGMGSAGDMRALTTLGRQKQVGGARRIYCQMLKVTWRKGGSVHKNGRSGKKGSQLWHPRSKRKARSGI
eukprot:jgi/Botrbrau1/9464/Bobra.0252s0085.1